MEGRFTCRSPLTNATHLVPRRDVALPASCDSQETLDSSDLRPDGPRAVELEQLIARHGRQVLSLARRLLGDRELARDAAQESWIRLYRNLHRVETGRPVWPYLARIVTNCCHDLRHHHRRHSAQHSSDLDELVSEQPDPSRRAEGAEALSRLRTALTRLSEREREALVLRDVEGLSTEEVALAMQTKVVTVRSHISRARLRLREQLGETP